MMSFLFLSHSFGKYSSHIYLDHFSLFPFCR